MTPKISSEVTEYFRAKCQEKDMATRRNYNRAGMALHRAGYTTMEAVCALTEEQLKWLRGVGAGTRAVIEKARAGYPQDGGGL